ncbi:MAG: aldo/keto reductase [Acidobacteriia bacterium]|nr:aldo/keto reductase [Terriglobia bacterium]
MFPAPWIWALTSSIPLYSGGNSERLLAQGLKGGLCQKVVLASKTPASDRKTFFADLESSLKNLETDHVDIWLLHAKDKPAAAPDELIEAGAEARKQGKIRFFGLSTHDIDAMVDRAVQTKLDVVIISYSFAMGASRDAAIAKAQAAGIGLVAMKVMAATGGGMPPARPARLKNPLAALKWVLKNPSITVAIPGTRDADMLEMNLRALTEKITPEDEKSLSARNEEIRPYYCRMCYRCTGQCPKGVPVPDQLRILAYADFYNDFPFARTNFQRLPEEVRAIRCQDCATCAVRCPNGVRVAERLIRAQEMLG